MYKCQVCNNINAIGYVIIKERVLCLECYFTNANLCIACGSKYKRYSSRQKYCSNACRQAAYKLRKLNSVSNHP